MGKTRISFDPEAAERETVVEEEAVDGDKAVKLDNGIVSDNEASSHYRSDLIFSYIFLVLRRLMCEGVVFIKLVSPK